jgi:two-component system, chemotaxis family, CheB/CheR fusion protein
VTAWNEGAHELWGLDANEVQGQHFMNLDIGLPVEQLMAALRSTVSTGEAPAPVTVEATNRRGRSITCRVSLSPLVGDGGSPRGAILFMEATDG